MKRKRALLSAIAAAAILAVVVAVASMYAAYPRPYRETVEKSGLSPTLVYSVIKAESGFDEDATSGAGAVGLMQIKPSTAEFICGREGIEFLAERLREGEYNVRIGCAYLKYLFEKFDVETALAAYNAGEGTVSEWLADKNLSTDGVRLSVVPYPETAYYLKKIEKFMKMYDFLY